MKKTFLTYLLICVCALAANAQHLRKKKAPGGDKPDPRERRTIVSAVGIGGGITYGTQAFNSQEGPLAQERYLLGFNGAGFVEFFHHPIYRWRLELQYNQLGTKELLYQPSGVLVTNRTNYISLNNYLKINFRPEGFVPYFLIGPRVEYLLNSSAGVYPDIIGSFYKFHVTGAIGLGAEMMWKSPLRPFIEVFYNHDLMDSYDYKGGYEEGHVMQATNINYRGYELRIGLKYFFEGLEKDVCPKVINPAGN